MAIQIDATTDTLFTQANLPAAVPITVMWWMQWPSNPGTDGRMVQLSNDPAICWESLLTTVGDKFHVQDNAGGSTGNNYAVPFNAWHSLAFTISAGNAFTLYHDAIDTTDAGTWSGSATGLELSVGKNSKSGDGALVGAQLYGLKIWTRALSGPDITAENASYSPVSVTNLYGSWLLTAIGATVADDSGNGHTLTRGGTSFSTVSDPPPLGGGGGGFMWL